MSKLIHMTGLILAAVFLNTKVHATTIHIDLAPHGSKKIENTHLFKINAQCRVICHGGSRKVLIRVESHDGAINGQPVSSGQAKMLTLHDQQSISVGASPGTKVVLVNQGDDPIQADCAAS